jgi:lysine 2,3-aminomutase
VDVVRIGTRVPVTLPQKLYDQELIDLLASAEKVWIQTHFNHPREITPEAARVCNSLLKAGMPVNNHSVLLKGVNDDLETIRRLMRALLRIKVRPYYLFHCDPVTGAGHFRTSVWKGLEIMEGLRGHLSGLGIPTYVVDSPHGGGKIPLMPNYLVSASDDAVVLRNYEGLLVRYQAEDKPATIKATPSRGVSALLQGDRTAIVPEHNERMARRRLKLVTVSHNQKKADHPECGCEPMSGEFADNRDGCPDSLPESEELVAVHGGADFKSAGTVRPMQDEDRHQLRPESRSGRGRPRAVRASR